MANYRLAWLILLVATSAVAQHTVLLAWQDGINPAPPATTYNVYRGNAACASNPVFSPISTGLQVLTFTDSGMAVGKYCYYATAIDAASGLESTPSNMVDVKVLPHAPTAMTGAQQQ